MPDDEWKELPPECVWVLTELSERQLPAEAARRLEEHLAVCPSCRRARQWDRQLAGLLGAGSLPVGTQPVERRLGTLLARRKAICWSGMAATLAAAATLLLGGAVAWWMDGPLAAPTPEPRAVAISSEDPSRSLDDLTILVAQPPVPALDRPQSTWLAVLVEACEGEL